MNRSRARTTLGKIAVLLFVFTGLLLVLPASYTAPLRNLLQILAPLQDAVSRLVHTATDTVDDSTDDADADVERRIGALRSAVELLAAQTLALRRENEILTGIRSRGLGPHGRLIPVKVIADDALAWRDSKLLLGGLRRGIRENDGLISNYFSIDLPERRGAREGLAVLSAEVLVGVIEHAGPFTSRARLLSDPATRMSVTVGRLRDGAFSTVGAAFWLAGRGRGRIEIRDVHHQYIASGAVAVGDIVLTRDDDSRLPPSVTIGTISDVARDPTNTLLYILSVDPGPALDDLRKVYVVDTSDRTSS